VAGVELDVERVGASVDPDVRQLERDRVPDLVADGRVHALRELDGAEPDASEVGAVEEGRHRSGA
jgi:hypothetical protein